MSCAEATSRRPLALVLLWLGLAPVATGCVVGPKFVKPEVSLNANWSESGHPRLTTQTATDMVWWKTFNDPTLDQFVELAYQQNLPLQIAGLRILEARARIGIAFSQLLPQNPGPIVSASAVGLSEHAANSANIDRQFGTYQIGFDATWEIDFWGKYRRGVKAAKASYFATVADYDDALISIAAEVARTYVLIRTFEVLIEQAHQNVAVQEEGLHIAEARFRHGATSELDVAQAASLLENTRASIPSLQASLQQTKNALSTLVGRPTGSVESLLAQASGIPLAPPQVAVSVPAELMRRRPDIRGAELRAIAQCDRIGVAKAELYPRLVLFGSIGTQTSSGGGAMSGNSSIRNLFGAGSLIYDAGVSLLWPILNYPRILNNVRVEDARFQQSLIEYVNTVLKAAQEVEDGIVGFLRQQEAAVFAQNAVAAAQTSVKLSFVQYREGAVNYQRVLDSQRTLLQTQNSLANTRSSVTTNLIALYKALGGGWELRLGDPVVPESTQREMQKRTNWGKYFSKPPALQKVNGSPPPQGR